MESKPKRKPSSGKKSPGKKPAARKIGYIFAIAFLLVFLYLVRHLDNWKIPWLTEEFDKCLFYIELSIYASILVQALLILYDNAWFKHLMQALGNVFGALSIIMLYVIYPFDFGNASWEKWVKIGLLVLFIVTVISIIVELVKGIKYLINEPDKE
jgi:hypothetical protein